MISGGPCSINGLPGMILGLTIPRLHTSFVATKVDLKNIAATEIVPVKAKKVYTEKELRTTLTDVTKDWFTYGDDEAEKKLRKNMFFWNAFL
jgi:GLPGLI family protein